MKLNFFKALLLVGVLGLAGCNNNPGPGDTLKVTFANYDDTVLYVDDVEYGKDAKYEGKTPVKPADDTYQYIFSGWDKPLENVTKSFTTKAVYTSKAIDGHGEDYDEWADSWSQPGHLYIHYLRTGSSASEYNDYAIWLWQNAPIDSEGTLWGATHQDVLDNFHEMSTSWMTNIGNSGADADETGRIMDIDLTRTDLVGGKTGNPVSFTGATRLGFLIIQQSSMGGGSHWVSDGGANTYIPDFDKHLNEKGYVHIYCVQGAVADFTFTYSDDVIENPVVDDDSGQYRSTYDVESSTSKYGVSETSESFKSLGVGYQIFVPSFKDSNNDGLGDIRGVIDALDYLDDLGVQVLWLTPIQASESYHGYDITDFYAIDSKFGTLEDYREMIYKAHQRGMKVLMDLVLNHTSKNNVWFKKSQRAETGYDEFGNEINYRDMYHWKFKGDKVQYYDGNSYKTINVEDHPDWYRDGESNYYYYGKFGSNMAELNYDCQATRDLVINMALYWMGFGLDGFRLDAVKHIYMKDEVASTESDIVISDYGTRTYYDEEKMEEVTVNFDYSSDLTKNVNYWKEFANRIKQIYPDCFLVGENFDGWGTRIAPYYQALDSQFDFGLYYHNQEWLYEKGPAYMANSHASETYDRFMSSSNATLGDTGVIVPGGKRPDFINSPFTSNHDTNRLINHMSTTDCVKGTSSEINRAKVGAASTILTPGISWIYYGDELGMSGNTDQHVTMYGNTNNQDLWYRQPFKWGDDTTTNYSFNSYQVEWDTYNTNLKSANEQMANLDDGDMYDFYKSLIEIKTMYGKNAKYYAYQFNGCEDVYYFQVKSDNGTFNIYINIGAKSLNANIDVGGLEVYALNGASKTGQLPAYGVIVTKA